MLSVGLTVSVWLDPLSVTSGNKGNALFYKPEKHGNQWAPLGSKLMVLYFTVHVCIWFSTWNSVWRNSNRVTLLSFSSFQLVMSLCGFLPYLGQNTVNDCSTNCTCGFKFTSCAENLTADNCGLKERQSQHCHSNQHLTAFPMNFPILPALLHNNIHSSLCWLYFLHRGRCRIVHKSRDSSQPSGHTKEGLKRGIF